MTEYTAIDGKSHSISDDQIANILHSINAVNNPPANCKKLPTFEALVRLTNPAELAYLERELKFIANPPNWILTPQGKEFLGI
jgi:hypothetical protein